MSADKTYLLSLFHTLITPINGIRGYSMIILEGNSDIASMPTEITDWVKKYSPTFDEWATKLGEIRTSDKRKLTADQLCQQMIEALEGIEIAMHEGITLSKNTYLEGKGKTIFDYIIGTFPNIFKYYKFMQDSLRQ